MEESPYFTSCLDKLPYLVLLFGEFFHYFPFNLLLGNIVGLQVEGTENFAKFTKFSSIFSI